MTRPDMQIGFDLADGLDRSVLHYRGFSGEVVEDEGLWLITAWNGGNSVSTNAVSFALLEEDFRESVDLLLDGDT